MSEQAKVPPDFWKMVCVALLKKKKQRLRIIETMLQVDEPMSAVRLARRFGVDVKDVAYDVRCLNKLGILRQVGQRPVRGSKETFYRLIGHKGGRRAA